MHTKSELYVSDSKFRIITYYPATRDVCRSYGKIESGETVKSFVRKFGIVEMCKLGGSKELWKYKLTKEEVQSVTNNFRKNAEKSNFEYIGAAEINR